MQLYRFPEPAAGSTKATATRSELRFPDGAHDAEAMLIEPDGTAALIFTKVKGGTAGVYRALLASTKPQIMTKVGAVTIRGEGLTQANLVTGADVVGDGAAIVVRTYWNGYLLRVPAGESFEAALAERPQRFDVPFMIQAEAICSTSDGTVLVTAAESRGAPRFALAVMATPR